MYAANEVLMRKALHIFYLNKHFNAQIYNMTLSTDGLFILSIKLSHGAIQRQPRMIGKPSLRNLQRIQKVMIA